MAGSYWTACQKRTAKLVRQRWSSAATCRKLKPRTVARLQFCISPSVWKRSNPRWPTSWETTRPTTQEGHDKGAKEARRHRQVRPARISCRYPGTDNSRQFKGGVSGGAPESAGRTNSKARSNRRADGRPHSHQHIRKHRRPVATKNRGPAFKKIAQAWVKPSPTMARRKGS